MRISPCKSWYQKALALIVSFILAFGILPQATSYAVDSYSNSDETQESRENHTVVYENLDEATSAGAVAEIPKNETAYASDQIIVILDESNSTTEQLDTIINDINEQAEVVGATANTLTDETAGSAIAVVNLPEDLSIDEALLAAANSSAVSFAQPNYRYQLLDEMTANEDESTTSNLDAVNNVENNAVPAADPESLDSDASTADTGTPDESAKDASTADASTTNEATTDASTADAILTESNTADEATADTSSPDASAKDATPTDTNTADEATPDASTEDTTSADPNTTGATSGSLSPSYIPNDPIFPVTSSNNGWWLNMVNATAAWDKLGQDMNNSPVTVGIIDTGMRLTHSDLKDNLWVANGDPKYPNGAAVAWDVAEDGPAKPLTAAVGNGGDDSSHGTHVAGIVSARTNNGILTSGVSNNAKILPVRIFSGNSATTDKIVQAFAYLRANKARYNIRVINMSLGGYDWLGDNDPAMHQQIIAAANEGIVTVCAAGNYGNIASYQDASGNTIPSYPSDYEEVISVAAVDNSGNHASYSDHNSFKDISAPGSAVYSTLSGSDSSCGTMTGTSMATPVVSGIVAMIFAVKPNLNVTSVKQILYSTAIDKGAAGWDPLYGWGIVDANAALAAAKDGVSNPVVPIVTPIIPTMSSISPQYCIPGYYFPTINATPTNATAIKNAGGVLSYKWYRTYPLGDSIVFETAIKQATEIPGATGASYQPSANTELKYQTSDTQQQKPFAYIFCVVTNRIGDKTASAVSDLAYYEGVAKNSALTITAASATKVYDGTPLTKSSFTRTALPPGVAALSVTISGSQTNVGSSANMVSSYKLFADAAKTVDVTGYYTNVKKVDGTLSVTTPPPALKPTLPTMATKTSYPGYYFPTINATPTNATAIKNAGGVLSYKWYRTYPLTATVDYDAAIKQGIEIAGATGASYQPPKNIEVRYKSSDTQKLKPFVYIYCVVTNKVGVVSSSTVSQLAFFEGVNKAGELTITAASASKVYDGKPLTKNSYTNTALPAGVAAISVMVSGSQTNVGSSANTISSYQLFADSAKTINVTGYFTKVKKVNGTLSVTAQAIKTPAKPTLSAMGKKSCLPGYYFPSLNATPTNAAEIKSAGGVLSYKWYRTYPQGAKIDTDAAVKQAIEIPGANAANYQPAKNIEVRYLSNDTKKEKPYVYIFCIVTNRIGEKSVSTVSALAHLEGVNKASALTLTAASATKAYDGKPLTKNSYTRSALPPLVAALNVTVSGSRTDIGTSNNNVASYQLFLDAAKTVNVTGYFTNVKKVSGTLNVMLKAPTVVTIAPTVGSGMVIDVPGASKQNSQQLQIYSNNRTPSQRFRIVPDLSNGYYTIYNVNSGLVLDVKGGLAKAGTAVQQYSSNGQMGQKWRLEFLSGNRVIFHSALNYSLVLDIVGGKSANGSKLQINSGNGSATQTFKLNYCESNLNGYTKTVRSALSDKVLDVAGASKANGANIQIYASNGTAAQKFRFVYDSNSGYYTIVNPNSGKVLDIEGGKTAAGTNVWQYSANSTNAQKWSIELVPGSKNSYVIYSALGTVLDVAGAKTSSGTNVWSYQYNGSNAQKWVI